MFPRRGDVAAGGSGEDEGGILFGRARGTSGERGSDLKPEMDEEDARRSGSAVGCKAGVGIDGAREREREGGSISRFLARGEPKGLVDIA